MKKTLLTITIYLSFSSVILACGYSEPEYVDFYDFFIGNKLERENCNCGVSGNVAEWNVFFDNKYKNEIEKIVFNSSVEEVEELLKKEKNKKYKEAFRYLIYAKELGKTSKRIDGSLNSYSWDYDEIIKEPEFSEELLDKGVKAFKKTKDKTLKMRYAYQVIRYLHYSKKYKEAIDFYEKNVPQLELKNEMYYYCLDQISGCYYSDEQIAKSAYGFLKVFENSKDRKLSARLSFSINWKWEFDSLLLLCSTTKEKVLAKTLISPTNYSYSDAEWIIKNAYDEEALLSIYFYDDIHEKGKYYWINQENLKHRSWYDESSENLAQKDIYLLKQILKHPQTTKKDFWSLCLAYLYFQEGEFTKANELTSNIDSLTIVKESRLKFFKSFYAAVAQNEVNDKTDNELFKVYEDSFKSLKGDEHNLLLDVYYTMLKTFYLYKNEVLKANLITLNKEGADQIYDLKQLNDLKQLYESKSRNKMENYLLSNSIGKLNITDYITEKIASYYLMENQFEKAKEYFLKVPQGYSPNIVSSYSYSRNYIFNGYSNIPKQIFSNNIKEGFQFDVNQILTDKTYLKPEFSFIKKVFTKKELNDYLIRLIKMAKNGSSDANYLLGNYYYNNSEFGYFRNILIYYPENNYCYSCHSNEILQDYTEISSIYYQNALELTNDIEKKAKITYLIAKNEAFISDYSDYSPSMYSYAKEGREIKRNDLFKELNSTYRNTDFYNEIINECKTFEFYVNNR